MIINYSFCIKLVPLVIFVQDARSHIHQIRFLLKRLIIAQLVMKFTAFYATPNVFTETRPQVSVLQQILPLRIFPSGFRVKCLYLSYLL